MLILVSDTSVLIDLERGGLLAPAFTCGLTMVVPDFLYECERSFGPFSCPHHIRPNPATVRLGQA
jgi:hypothetical protein